MEEALQRSHDSSGAPLKVSVLLDYTRGSRGCRLFYKLLSLVCSERRARRPELFCVVFHAGQVNSRTILLPLLRRFSSQMRVSLYHTPDLRGLLRLLVPQRFNETIGVQHIKVYLFDDNIIISGYVDASTVWLHTVFFRLHTTFWSHWPHIKVCHKFHTLLSFRSSGQNNFLHRFFSLFLIICGSSNSWQSDGSFSHFRLIFTHQEFVTQASRNPCSVIPAS